MKTMSFGTIKVEHKGGECILEVYSPRDGTVRLSISPDELLLFLVELSNGLYKGRLGEIKKLIEYNLEKEQRKVKI